MMTITVAGAATSVPAFTVFEATINPQQKSAARNGNGRLVRETLPDKWTLTMEWEFSNPQQFYDWCKYLSDLTRVDFKVEFPAPTGEIITTTFYISPISARMINFSKGNAGWWQNLKCKFVEV